MDHIRGARHDRQQRVVAPHVVVGELGATLLLEPVGLADGGVDVDGHRRVARAGARRPRSGQQLARDLVELAGVAPCEAAQERPQRRGGEYGVAENGLGRPRPQRVGVVDRVAAGQRGVDEGHRLVADVGVPGGVAQVDVLLEQLPQAHVLGERGRQHQPGVGYRVGIVEGHGDAIEGVR